MWRRFLLAWRFARDLRYNEAAVDFPWTELDQRVFQAFMTSRVGVLFGARMNNFAIQKAMASVHFGSGDRPGYAAGVAYGVQLTIQHIDSHLPPIKPKEEEMEAMSEEEKAIQRVLDEVSNA